MAGANVNLGVTGLAQFKRDIKAAKETVKAFDEALKLNEQQADTSTLYVSNKIELMKQQIEAQIEVVQNTQAQLDQMVKNGTPKNSASYQKLLGQSYSEQSKLEEMKKNLQAIESGASGAAENLRGVNESVNEINQNTSWNNVAEGIGKVADTLERGAKAAYNFGKKIINSLKGSSGWADDLQTMSDTYDIPKDKLQRMEKVAYIVETDTEAILAARDRMSRAVAGEGREDIAELLGISISGNEDPEDLMWTIGDALLHMDNSFDKASASQKIFGRSWRELVPLFKTGREEYEKMLAEQDVLTDAQIQSLVEADDTIAKMELEIQQLKNEFWSENADKITGLLQWMVDNKESVVTALEAIGIAFGTIKIAGLAANIAKIVNGFKTLGLLGGGKAASAAAASSAGAAGTATAGGAAMGVGGALAGVLLGYPILKKISEEGMDWLNPWSSYYDSKNGKHAQVLDTIGGAGTSDIYERLLHPTEIGTAGGKSFAPEEIEAKQVTVISDDITHRDRRSQSSFEGGEYYDRSLDRMTAVAEQTSANEIQSNSEVTAALGNLQGLPAAMAAAVQAGMASVTIVVNESAVGAIGKRVGKQLGSGLRQMVK